MPTEDDGRIAASRQFRLIFSQLLHRILIAINQGHDLAAAMRFFAEGLLTQAVFLEEDFTNFRQQETVLTDDSRIPGNPDDAQDLMIHDDRIIDPSADAVLKPVFLNSLDLTGPGSNMAGLMVRSDTSAIRTGHDTPMTVDEVDIPADDSPGRIDDLLGQFIRNAYFHLNTSLYS